MISQALKSNKWSAKVALSHTGCKPVQLKIDETQIWCKVSGGVMKITQFWDLFYHLESVPDIKCQGVWCQVSGVRCQDMGNTNWRYLKPDT